MTTRALHVASELYPLLKTGGLADVVGALPPALIERGADVRVLLPGFPSVAGGLADLRPVARLGSRFGIDAGDCAPDQRGADLRARFCSSTVQCVLYQQLLVDHPGEHIVPGR